MIGTTKRQVKHGACLAASDVAAPHSWATAAQTDTVQVCVLAADEGVAVRTSTGKVNAIADLENITTIAELPLFSGDSA